MRTAIYGAGSLGTILGAFINKAGMPIDLINRNKAHVEALNSNGASVTGTMQFNQKVNAYTPDMMSGEYDIIFLMTKQQNNKEVEPKYVPGENIYKSIKKYTIFVACIPCNETFQMLVRPYSFYLFT